MNLVTRVISAAVLLPFVLWALHLGGLILLVFITICWVIACLELFRLTKVSNWHNFYVLLVGSIYISLGLASTLFLREYFGYYAVILVLLATFSSDTCAYLAGNLWGRYKIAPKISPKKTWEGFIGGAIGCVLIPYLFLDWLGGIRLQDVFFLGLPIAILAPAGDLLESFIKRKYGVKDSGNLIPGHGGMLDRIDALLATMPYALLYFTCLR